MPAQVSVKLKRQRDPVRTAPVSVGRNKVAHNRRDDPVDNPSGKRVRPIANRLPSHADARTDDVGVFAKQGKGDGFFHRGDDLTPARPSMQTEEHDQRNLQSDARKHRTPADASGRQRTSRLIDRLDIAMKESGVSGPKLAAALGIKPQSFTNLRRKEHGGMRAELLAHAANVLHCDLHWLCTGEGGEFVPARDVRSRLAREVAAWLEEMSDDDRWRAYNLIIQIRRGYWPAFADDGTARSAT
jgi:transcriptional regulator with XRE-family HTH domain